MAIRATYTRAKLAVREVMVRNRAKYTTLVCSLLRRDGFRVSTGASRYFRLRLRGWNCRSLWRQRWLRWWRC